MGLFAVSFWLSGFLGFHFSTVFFFFFFFFLDGGVGGGVSFVPI